MGDWHLEIHDRLRRLYVDGLSALADARTRHGDHAGAAETLERLVAKEDLREDAWRRLAHALTLAGRRDRAIAHLNRFTVLLESELGAAPETETLRLLERIRAGDSG